MAIARARTIRTRRIKLRATDRQEKLIRTGAETTGVRLTDFILESACLLAEHILADRHGFAASPETVEGVPQCPRPPGSRETGVGTAIFRAVLAKA
jgi:uncharacterized protein (DUF1778 family)